MTHAPDTLGSVRKFLIFLLAASVLAQDSPDTDEKTVDDHDKYGFPITFDTEVITMTDLVRAQGLDRVEQIGRIDVARDQLLMEKLTERVGELYGLTVEDRDVEDWIRKQIRRFDSEAEFYEDLLQQGLTLETYREETKRKVLAARLNQLIRQGYLPQGQRLLPWDPHPSPKEIRVAYENDPERLAAGTLVRWQELRLAVPDKQRRKIAAQGVLNPDLTQEDIQKQLQEALEPVLKRAKDEFAAGRSLEEVAKALGTKLTTNEQELSKKESTSALLRFLQTAEKDAQSGLIDIGQGRFVVAKVLMVKRSDTMTLNDPTVVESYRLRIGELKQAKADFTLRLRALDRSLLKPERVREGLRKLLLSQLANAHQKLRALGLH